MPGSGQGRGSLLQMELFRDQEKAGSCATCDSGSCAICDSGSCAICDSGSCAICYSGSCAIWDSGSCATCDSPLSQGHHDLREEVHDAVNGACQHAVREGDGKGSHLGQEQYDVPNKEGLFFMGIGDEVNSWHG